MNQKLKVTKVYRGQQDTKYGKKDKVAIKTEEYGEKWLSCFVTGPTRQFLDTINEGDTIEVEVTTKGDFVNFKPLTSAPSQDLEELKNRITKLEDAVFGAPEDSADEPPKMDVPPEEDF